MSKLKNIRANHQKWELQIGKPKSDKQKRTNQSDSFSQTTAKPIERLSFGGPPRNQIAGLGQKMKPHLNSNKIFPS